MSITVNNIVYKYSKHAKTRAKKRGVEEEDIIEALENPKRTFTTERDESIRINVLGKNSVLVVLTPENLIVTVYKRSKQLYKNRIKENYNKKRRELKKRFGNRVKH